jgi:hypothetical protein
MQYCKQHLAPCGPRLHIEFDKNYFEARPMPDNVSNFHYNKIMCILWKSILVRLHSSTIPQMESINYSDLLSAADRSQWQPAVLVGSATGDSKRSDSLCFALSRFPIAVINWFHLWNGAWMQSDKYGLSQNAHDLIVVKVRDIIWHGSCFKIVLVKFNVQSRPTGCKMLFAILHQYPFSILMLPNANSFSTLIFYRYMLSFSMFVPITFEFPCMYFHRNACEFSSTSDTSIWSGSCFARAEADDCVPFAWTQQFRERSPISLCESTMRGDCKLCVLSR